MITPVIHINGTSAESLLHGYLEAGQALKKAIECALDCAPNARDYAEEAFRTAATEHRLRLEKLQSVLADFTAIHENILGQVDAREAARRR